MCKTSYPLRDRGASTGGAVYVGGIEEQAAYHQAEDDLVGDGDEEEEDEEEDQEGEGNDEDVVNIEEVQAAHAAWVAAHQVQGEGQDVEMQMENEDQDVQMQVDEEDVGMVDEAGDVDAAHLEPGPGIGATEELVGRFVRERGSLLIFSFLYLFK